MKELNEVNENPRFVRYMTEEEDKRKIFNSKMKEAIETGLREGRKEGVKEGIEQGIVQEKIEIAKKMLNIGLKEKDILKSTGLSIEEIKRLK